MTQRTRTLLLFLIFCVPAFALEPEARGESGAKPAAEKVRVLSYNIHMWQIRVDELAAIIRKSEADIIGLNEAWDEKQNEAIAKELAYNSVFGGCSPIRKAPAKAHTINGFYMPQVLLTKHKIIRSEVFNAMAAKDHERFDPDVPIYRGGTMALLETAKGNRLVVFVLHLHPWGDRSNEKMTSMRLREIEGIRKKLEPYRGLPTLIMGDFNTRSHFDVRGGGKVTPHLAGHGYKDLYRSVHPDIDLSPGLTCGDGRIDYIFYNKHFSPVSSEVVKHGVFGSLGYRHSDHLAVSGVLEMKTK